MAITSKKLGYGKGGVNLINLYDNIQDVGGSISAFPVEAGNKILYAKIGDITHQQASKWGVGKGGLKCLLFRASTAWNFKNLRSTVESDGYSNRIGDTSINLQAKYKDSSGNWLGSISQSCIIDSEFTIPQNAKNIIITMDYNCSQAGCQYYITLYKESWRGFTTKLLRVEGSEMERVTIESGKETGSWDNPNGGYIIPGKYSRGTVSMRLGTGWYGIEFKVDSTDLAVSTGSFSIGQFKIEFEEN